MKGIRDDILPSFDQYSHIPGICHRQAPGGQTEMENPGEDVAGAIPDWRIGRRPYRDVLLPAQDMETGICVWASHDASGVGDSDPGDGDDSEMIRIGERAG